SAKGFINVTYQDTIEGWGTLTTPLWSGQTYSTLCQKHYELDIDSIYVHSTVLHSWIFYSPAQKTKMYQYRWYTNGIGDLVGLMTTDSTGKKVKSMQWYDGIPNSINELSKQNNTLTYPNPCTNQITFRFNQQNAQNIYVYDMAGRELGNAAMHNGTVVLGTAGYSAGMYFYHITDNLGNVIGNGKFTVVQ
ncbi:MAG TPA: T9SS type A sorting domain-containing protein, partial [Bacteroidia bacterium]|nr:T9SS type A sorting domain-containing protein [Bacteroidia bacterium]